MTIETVDVAVIGAGPAGLSAAGEAARLGARVALIDDNRQPGGQYFRQPPPEFAPAAQKSQDKDRTRYDALRRGIENGLVSYRPGATVWDVPEPLTLAITDGLASGRIKAQAIVIAAGARDRVVAFPGWTLPGIMTAGGLQNLIKGMRVAPSGPAVVAGNGPLLLVAAASLVRAGVQVTAVVEAAEVPARVPWQAARLALAPSILRLAAQYRALLASAGTRMLYGRAVIAAHGDRDLASLDIAGIGTDGSIDKSRTERIEAHTLVTGFGLTPSLELPRLLGAEEVHLPLRGGPALHRDARLMTSVPGVFAAGDGAAIGGVELSLVEGRLAGLEAAAHAGVCTHPEILRPLARDRRTLRRLNLFRTGLERVFAPPASWLGLLTPDTIICRCEDVALGDITSCMADDNTTAVQIKAVTRAGMGRCQGRNCQATITAVIAECTGRPADEIAMAHPRQPARPILLGDLMHEDLPPPDLPDDPHLPRRR